MSKIWKPQSNEVYRQWIDAIVDEASDQVNDWEMNFIHDMDIKVFNNWTLTQSQAEKLESIYTKYTS